MSALKIKKGSSSHSAYDLRDYHEAAIERHTLAVIVDNEAGVLARVIGLFSGRGYNIESLTVAEIDHTGHHSRITVVTKGTPQEVIDVLAKYGRETMESQEAIDLMNATGAAVYWQDQAASEARIEVDRGKNAELNAIIDG